MSEQLKRENCDLNRENSRLLRALREREAALVESYSLNRKLKSRAAWDPVESSIRARLIKWGLIRE